MNVIIRVGRVIASAGALVVLLAGCPSPLPELNNPYDPESAASPLGNTPASTNADISVDDQSGLVTVDASWDAIPEAERYHVQIADRESFDEAFIRFEDDQLTDTSAQWNGAADEVEYWIRLRYFALVEYRDEPTVEPSPWINIGTVGPLNEPSPDDGAGDGPTDADGPDNLVLNETFDGQFDARGEIDSYLLPTVPGTRYALEVEDEFSGLTDGADPIIVIRDGSETGDILIGPANGVDRVADPIGFTARSDSTWISLESDNPDTTFYRITATDAGAPPTVRVADTQINYVDDTQAQLVITFGVQNWDGSDQITARIDPDPLNTASVELLPSELTFFLPLEYDTTYDVLVTVEGSQEESVGTVAVGPLSDYLPAIDPISIAEGETATQTLAAGQAVTYRLSGRSQVAYQLVIDDVWSGRADGTDTIIEVRQGVDENGTLLASVSGDRDKSVDPVTFANPGFDGQYWILVESASDGETSFDLTLDVSGPLVQSLSFDDAAIAQAVSDASDAITRVGELTDLSVDGGVSTLAGIEQLTNLRSFRIGGNVASALTDLSPLSALPMLDRIVLRDTQVTDITPLAGLEHLNELRFSRAPLANILPLAGMESLTRLFVELTQVSDVSVVQNLPNLDTFWANITPVSDIAPLENHPSLTSVLLDSTSITDVSPLATIPTLTFLGLDNTSVSDISPVANLPNLESLSFDNTAVTSLAPLFTGSAPLRFLFASRLGPSNDSLTTIAGVSALSGLERLQLGNNTALTEGFDEIATLDNLDTISLYRTAFSDMTVLTGKPDLRVVSVNDTQVTDLSPIFVDGSRVETLQASNLPTLTSVAGIGELQQLSILLLRDNPQLSTGVAELATVPTLISADFFNSTSIPDEDLQAVIDAHPTASITRPD